MDLRHELDDPLTREALVLGRVLSHRITYVVSARPELYLQYKDAVHELKQFCKELEKPRINSDRLSYLLDRYTGVLALVESAAEFFSVKVAARERSKSAYIRLAEHAEVAPRMLEAFRLKLEVLTPPQTLMQRHLKLFVYRDFSWEIPTEEIIQMLAPLITLRDRYFLRPEHAVLMEYLASAEAIGKTGTYSERSSQMMTEIDRQAQQAELADLALELEVLGMVDSAYNGTAMSENRTEASHGDQVRTR
jgi:hypothetical protein